MNPNFINHFNQEILQYQLSIYIHWPFCLSKCPYCDFNSHVSNKINQKEWLNCYLKEFNFFKHYFHNRKITSIYFGGGTPSLMEPFLIKEIIDFLRNNSQFDQNIEITLEANPTSIEYNKFLDFHKAGINRVSIGVQSLIQKDLKFLGRNHNPQEALDAIKMAQEIFPRYSFDLIYARPKQTLDAWQKELEHALKLVDDHISLYQLTIEKGTQFFQMYKNKEFSIPEDKKSNDLYFLTDKILKKHGLESYEISNYAKNNAHSKHNMCYWQYDDYLGIGPGAHSRIRNSFKEHYAFNAIYRPNNWLEQVDKQNNGIQKYEKLSLKEIIEEIIITGLRIKNGIRHTKSIEKLGHPIIYFLDNKILDFLINENLIIIDEYCLKTTEKGFRLIDYLVNKLTDNIICNLQNN